MPVLSFAPLVSICIPAYNAEKYIAETLNSILSQSYSNIELIVVNDGSTDNTFHVAQSINDKRVKIIQQSNKGASASRNEAFKQSKGEYIVFVDADDLINHDYLYNQILTVNGKTDSVVLAQWGRFTNNDLTTFKLVPNPDQSMTLQTWVKEFWYHVNPMTNPGRILIPRNLIEKAGLWNENLTLNDDLEFFTRIFDNSNVLIFNNESTLYYRSGVNGLSGIRGKKAYTSLYNSLKLSTEIVSKKYNNEATKKACANMWQSFIYIVYPNENHLIKLVEKELNNLVKSNLKFPTGGITKIIINLLGWKMTVHLKNKIAQISKN